jgi:hypothetical protein
MYSLSLGAIDPDAPQGLKKGMMHPTAVTAAAIAPRRASNPRRRGGQRLAIDWVRAELRSRAELVVIPARWRLPLRLDSVFRGRTANSLEMPGAAFHYSVISRHAKVSLAAGYVAWRPLKDEVAASKSPYRNSGVSRLRCSCRASLSCVCGSEVSVLCRRDEEVTKNAPTPWAGCDFEPAEERTMQMTAVSPTKQKWMSRSRMAE